MDIGYTEVTDSQSTTLGSIICMYNKKTKVYQTTLFFFRTNPQIKIESVIGDLSIGTEHVPLGDIDFSDESKAGYSYLYTKIGQANTTPTATYSGVFILYAFPGLIINAGLNRISIPFARLTPWDTIDEDFPEFISVRCADADADKDKALKKLEAMNKKAKQYGEAHYRFGQGALAGLKAYRAILDKVGNFVGGVFGGALILVWQAVKEAIRQYVPI